MELDDEMYPVIPDWVYGLFPEAPIGFLRVAHPLTGPWTYREIGPRHMAAMRVICTARVEADGARWMHVSCSRPEGLPNWADLGLVKRTFIGDERIALQVFPRQVDYVNHHPNVLHLWARLDGGDPVPDFRVKGII